MDKLKIINALTRNDAEQRMLIIRELVEEIEQDKLKPGPPPPPPKPVKPQSVKPEACAQPIYQNLPQISAREKVLNTQLLECIKHTNSLSKEIDTLWRRQDLPKGIELAVLVDVVNNYRDWKVDNKF